MMTGIRRSVTGRLRSISGTAWWNAARRAARHRRDRAGQQVPQLRLAAEEDLALVGEVAEEGPLGEAGAGGDVPGRGLVVAALQVQLERGLLQQPPHFIPVPWHGLDAITSGSD
jgi:hypothetical protein